MHGFQLYIMFFSSLVLALAVLVGRMPRRPLLGVVAGVATGLLVGFVLPIAIGLVTYILPRGQMSFYVASHVCKMPGIDKISMLCGGAP